MSLFIEHVNTVLNKLRQETVSALSTDTNSEAYKAQIAVRRAVSKVWNHRAWTFKQRETTMSTVAGQATYKLPKDVGEPYLVLSSASPYFLKPITQRLFDIKVPNPTEEGDPRAIILFSQNGVTTQPTEAHLITVVSSSTSDTTQTITIKGIVSDEIDVETVALNGTASVSTVKLFSKILSVTKSANTVGRVTLSEDAVSLLVMGINEKTSRLRQCRLWPEVQAVRTITFKHFQKAPTLESAYEDTEIPENWDYVVDQYAFALAVQGKGQDQLAEFQSQIGLATSFLEDMVAEEKQSENEVLEAMRAFEEEEGGEGWIPSGYNIV